MAQFLTLDCKTMVSIRVCGKSEFPGRFRDWLYFFLEWSLDTSPWLKYSSWVAKQWFLSESLKINKTLEGPGVEWCFFRNGSFDTWSWTEERSWLKTHVFYSGAWEIEIARRVLAPLADFPEVV